MNRNKNPVEEGVDPRGRGGVVASLPWAEAIKGEERGWWWNPTMISLVLRFQSPEVSGRWFMLTTVTVLFLFFNLAYLLFLSGQNAQLCSSHGVRYKGPRLERKPCGPKPPTTVLPATPKLKPSDPPRQRNKNPPPGTMGRNSKEVRPRA